MLTEGLARSLAALDPISADVVALKGGASEFLAEVITRQLGAILDDVAGDDTDQPRRQLELVNDLLVMLRQRLSTGGGSAASMASADVVDLVASPLRVLRAVKRDQQFPASPEIGLAMPWLFTAGKGSPSLLQEIRRELASSDQVDILVSFITVSGVRKLQDVLQQITATGGQRQGRDQSATRLRILTTTYTGATEARALDELARLPGCEVRVSLDGWRTRRLPSAIPCSIGPTLYPHGDAHSNFTASKTVNRLLSIKISRLKVNERLTETRREGARPLARSSTELTKSSVAAKSNSVRIVAQRPDRWAEADCRPPSAAGAWSVWTEGAYGSHSDGHTRWRCSLPAKLAPDWHQPSPESKKVSRR